ncbi:Uma2 family endonuclease [Planotetraspora sp. A-T 1434]|uniref:Uma2 family endonuclease n=1 Tax=Planotetraspora sp. A-T 1434 TaxID=2979219 RepID=UPI0021C15644|nr:Uma2 family endonuclease [Planotetraspora sp. A-T 1434]MCT9930551.1 Uma2 family endonuclease [Planotetraspora sp. A-T 1434]
MTTALPEWFYPGPPGGWTADMLDHLPPDAPRHVELIDGSLIMMSPQTAFHMLMLRLLERELAPPPDLLVVREMTVTLGLRQRPEPDILVVKSAALKNLKTTSFKPDDVHLVVEVTSPESLDRDRVTKPIKYSDAGIRYLWRVEQEDEGPVVYTFELEPSVKAYVPTGIHRKRLQTDIGFEVDIDLDLGQFTR